MLLDVIFELLDIVKRTGREKQQKDLPKSKENRDKEQRVRQEPSWIIEEYLLQHFRDPEGLAGLAAQLYLSERQTRNLVKKYYGQEYKTLIIKQRMEFADMLLSDTTRSLEEIAEEVGYRSYSGFYQAYTKYFGISPSDRRQKISEDNHAQ
jgi:AraC-like DNA-binding protein